MSSIPQKERLVRIAQLLAHLDNTNPNHIPAECFHAVRLVPGWGVVRGPYKGWTVDAPDRPGLQVQRAALIALLQELWAPEARAELASTKKPATPEPTVTDGITEALRMEPVVHTGGTVIHTAVSLESMLTSRDEIAGLVDSRGRELSDHEARTKLLDAYFRGVRVMPIGKACDDFDSVTGCPGHRAAR